MVGGREINPFPTLHDKCHLINDYISFDNSSVFNSGFNSHQFEDKRIELASLPNSLSHMQTVVVKSNFLFVLGGCTSQCAHGESAVGTVHRYDPRLNNWIIIKSMQAKRAYFYACASEISENDGLIESSCQNLFKKQFMFAIGGKNREGALCSVERYDMTKNTWEFVRSLPASYYAHSGCVLNNMIYITGNPYFFKIKYTMYQLKICEKY